MTPDPKWLEILKASGWQTAALAVAFGVLLLIIRFGWIVSPDPWFTAFCALAFLISLSLALASVGREATELLQPKARLRHWLAQRHQRRMARESIPFMTEREKLIVGYLLAKNQKMITADRDGGHASTLISKGILCLAMQHNQSVRGTDVPFVVPDCVWDELVRQKQNFPYSPTQRSDGVEPHPWRVPWMAR
jgi:hypothetical protein